MGNFHSVNFAVDGISGDRFPFVNGNSTTVDTGSCTSQMLYMFAQNTSSFQGNINQDPYNTGQTSTIRCEDDMKALTILATVTSCVALLLLIIFSIVAVVSGKTDMKRSNKAGVNAVMSAVLFVLSIPALGGCWSFVTRKATYDMGPVDYVGFWILYFIFVGPVLCAWPCALMCGAHNEGGDHWQAPMPDGTAATAVPSMHKGEMHKGENQA